MIGVEGHVVRFDGPETALAPQRQLKLLAMMPELSSDGARVIIATPSPLLLAYLGGVIFSVEDDRIEPIA